LAQGAVPTGCKVTHRPATKNLYQFASSPVKPTIYSRMLLLMHSSSNAIMSSGQRRRANYMSWVICAETFLAVVAFSYITMMCFTHPDLESRQGVVETVPISDLSAAEITAAEMKDVAFAATWTGMEVKVSRSPDRTMSEARDEKPDICDRENKYSTVLAAFVVAFMAGGFMNLERIQGLPLP